MGYEIKTIEYHAAALGQPVKNRDHLDVSDCALSSWADGQMRVYHQLALDLLENGKAIGIDGPAAEKTVLCDKRTGRELDAWTIRTQYGTCWMLADEEEARYGRKFIPTGPRSRVQRQLELGEFRKMTPCKRWLGTSCAGRGCPVNFFPEFS